VLIISVHFCVGRKESPATFRRLLDSCMEVPTYYLPTWTMDDLELSVRQGESGNSVLRDRLFPGTLRLSGLRRKAERHADTMSECRTT
jgi:hypothetical protein